MGDRFRIFAQYAPIRLYLVVLEYFIPTRYNPAGVGKSNTSTLLGATQSNKSQLKFILFASLILLISCNRNGRIESDYKKNNLINEQEISEDKTFIIAIDTIFELYCSNPYSYPYSYELSLDKVYIVAANQTLLISDKNSWDTLGQVKINYYINRLFKTENFFLIGTGDEITKNAFILDLTTLEIIDTIPNMQYLNNTTKDKGLFIDIFAATPYYGIIDFATMDTIKIFNTGSDISYFHNRYFMEDSLNTVDVYNDSFEKVSSFYNIEYSGYFDFGYYKDHYFGLCDEFIRFFYDKNQTQDIYFETELYTQKYQLYNDCLYIYGWTRSESTFRLMRYTISE